MTHRMAPDGVPIMPALFVGHGNPMNAWAVQFDALAAELMLTGDHDRLVYDGREVIYVGRTTDRPLGRRLYEHTIDQEC